MNQLDRHHRPRGSALAGLAVPAPATLRPAVLVEVGLADAYARDRLPARAARRGLERPRRLDASARRDDDAASRRATGHRPAARAFAADAAATAGERDRAPARRRSAGPHRPRPARPQPVRAGRLAQGARDPARRGPAVRLGRRRDRPAEGGPRGRDGARPQPGPADRAVPPRRPHATARSASTRWAARRTSGRSWPPRASIRTRWRMRAGAVSGSWVARRPRSCAGRRAGPGATCSSATAGRSGHWPKRVPPDTGPARSAARSLLPSRPDLPQNATSSAAGGPAGDVCYDLGPAGYANR